MEYTEHKIKVIALTGYKQSGKSTAGDHLEDMYRKGYTKLRFANGIKRMMLCLGINDNCINGSDKELPLDLLCGKSTRYAMQTLGTEWGRKLMGEDFWVKQLGKRLSDYVKLGVTRFVIDDLRFLNEERFINSLRFAPYNYDVKIIRVKRDGCIETNHQSEKEISEIVEDWTVYNNSTKKNLYRSIDDIIGS